MVFTSNGLVLGGGKRDNDVEEQRTRPPESPRRESKRREHDDDYFVIEVGFYLERKRKGQLNPFSGARTSAFWWIRSLFCAWRAWASTCKCTRTRTRTWGQVVVEIGRAFREQRTQEKSSNWSAEKSSKWATVPDRCHCQCACCCTPPHPPWPFEVRVSFFMEMEQSIIETLLIK